jgi:hypothetical protein
MTPAQENTIRSLDSSLKGPSHYINIRIYGGDSLELHPMIGSHLDGRRMMHFCQHGQTLPEIADVATYCRENGIPYSIEGKAARDYLASLRIPHHNL